MVTKWESWSKLQPEQNIYFYENNCNQSDMENFVANKVSTKNKSNLDVLSEQALHYYLLIYTIYSFIKTYLN